MIGKHRRLLHEISELRREVRALAACVQRAEQRHAAVDVATAIIAAATERAAELAVVPSQPSPGGQSP